MDKPVKEILDSRRPLLDVVVEWLFEKRLRQSEGAPSLAHLMVVVPTAQSGRNLRLALARAAAARGLGGVIPPKVVQPKHLVKPAAATLREATPVEAALAFQQYVKTHRDSVLELDRLVWPDSFEDLTARFALYDQLADIWRTLAGRGLVMQDVREADLADDLADEWGRWEQLAALEKGYFEYLHEHALVYPTEAIHLAKTSAAIVGDETEEIVLPALADPIRVLGDVLAQQLAAGKRVTVLQHTEKPDKFDEWGWPVTAAWTGGARPNLDSLADANIVGATDFSELAQRVAGDFPPVEGRSSLPALALCDGELYPAVAAAFLNRGYVVHNPERHLLVQSSLGRLLKNLIALYPAGDLPWRECLALLRSSDVQAALALGTKRREAMLKGADVAQNALIPSVIPAGFAFPADNDIQSWQQDDFAAFCETGRELERMLSEAREGASLAVFLRRMLQRFFRGHVGGGRADEKEFLAAVESARAYLAELENPLIAELAPSPAELEAIARRQLDAVSYSLEPDSAEAIRTEGWLELPWTAGAQIALVGLHEGKVPDAIVGHPFLPDRLRAKLGLVTNADRLARDSWILEELLSSHAPDAVRAYVARTNDDGDICRPSRLLYLCDDGRLPARVRTLIGDLPAVRKDKRRILEWPLNLPDAVPAPDHFSASALDTYVKCPFTYLLKYGLRMNVFKEKRELEANDFGTYIHEALRRYAERQIARGDDQLTDAVAILRLLREEILPPLRARFARPTLNVSLQLDAADGRLAFFAEKQAAWASRGWRIRAAEYAVRDEIAELGVKLHGSIDRVDENILAKADERRWCVIDYKTWDECKITGRAVTSSRRSERNEAQLELARRLGYPRIPNRDGRDVQRMLSVQLPVYGLAYAAKHGDVPVSDMQFGYFILGATAEETGIGDKTMLSQPMVDAAIATAKRAVDLIGKGIFWPPGPTDEWKWDFPGLFLSDPASDLGDTEWARRQQRKLEVTHV